MALTQRQQNTPINHVHQTIYPYGYTITSTESAQDNFLYKFRLMNTNGLLSTSPQSPRGDDEIGIYSPIGRLKNQFGLDFQPYISGFTSCPNSIVQYNVEVDEFYNNVIQSSAQFFPQVALKCAKKDFDWREYVLNSNTSKWLTEWESERKVSLTGEYGNLRFLSGFQNQFSNFVSQTFQLQLELTQAASPGFVLLLTSNWQNPYWQETVNNNDLTSPPGSSEYDIRTNAQMGKHLLEVPVTPQVINSLNWKLLGWTNGGVWFDFPLQVPNGGFLAEGDSYNITMYHNPDGGFGINGLPGVTSKKMSFKIEAPCQNSNAIQIHWENSLGGFDFMRFDKANKRSISIERTNFRKIEDEIGLANRYSYGHNSLSRGLLTVHNDIETFWTVNTDILTKQEVLDMQYLWYSKNVYAYINDVWYPIVGLTEARDLDSTKRSDKIRQYQFDFQLANKIYN